MERIIQWLDDLDDLVWALRLVSERIRYRTIALFTIFVALAIQAGGIILAVVHPPLALAMALLLFVSLLYRAVTAAHEPLEIA